MFMTHIDFDKVEQALALLPAYEGRGIQSEEESNLFIFQREDELEAFTKTLYEA